MRLQLALMMAILLSAAAPAGADDEERFSPKAEEVGNAKREEIRAEVQVLGSHGWAGEYYAGDGLGVNTTLLLVPRSGYVFEWHGCLGLYDRNYGSVDSTERILRLSFTFDNVREGFRGIAPELTVVDWGSRRYLVPADDLIDFCNSVNQGAEPRTDEHGQHLLRLGDESKEVSGSPELPAEYRACLLPSPVEANVLTIGASLRPATDPGWELQVTRVALDAGRKQGLRIGMELFVFDPDSFDRVRITKVEDDRAEATMIQVGESPGPEVGWRVSTRPWYMERTRVTRAARWLGSLF